MKNIITEQDTWDCFISTGALGYGWYAEVDGDHEEFKQEGENHWEVTFVDGVEPVADERHTLNHEKIMAVLKDLAHKHIDEFETDDPETAGPDTMRECAQFLANKEYADFDAGSADVVMQQAAFGKVSYS